MGENELKISEREMIEGVAALDYPLLFVVPRKTIYSSTKIFLPAHISFKIFGHTVTLTSPR